MLTVVDAEPHHVTQFAMGDIRQEDVDEWVLGSGVPVRTMLLHRLNLDEQYVRALLNADGKCIALWGVSLDGEPGVVWLIASPEAETVGRRIHRFWPMEVGLMHMRHVHLTALAYANNTLHLKWLQQIGFVATDEVPLGPGAVPFILYQRRHECAHQQH